MVSDRTCWSEGAVAVSERADAPEPAGAHARAPIQGAGRIGWLDGDEISDIVGATYDRVVASTDATELRYAGWLPGPWIDLTDTPQPITASTIWCQQRAESVNTGRVDGSPIFGAAI